MEEYHAVCAGDARRVNEKERGFYVKKGVFVYERESHHRALLSILKCVHNNLMVALKRKRTLLLEPF